MKKVRKDKIISNLRFQISMWDSLTLMCHKPMRFLKPHRFVPLILPPSLFVLILLFSNCQETEEKCLDAKATNFEVDGYKSCKNCCEYPYLRLTVDFVKEELSKTKLILDDSLNPNMVYKIGLDSIQIFESQFYLSDFQLFSPENKVFRTIDSTTLNRQKDTIRTLSNYALVSKEKGFDFKIGHFNQSGKFIKFQFKVGLDDVANKTDPSKMPQTHPLSTQRERDSMYLKKDMTYVFNRLAVARWRNPSKKDTLRFSITTPKDVVILKDMSFKEGYDIAIPLTINYAKLIEGVNFSDTENAIKEKIVSNYAKAFSIIF
jgi:hypothetical protein